MKALHKVKPLYIAIVVILLIPMAYIGFRQYTVKSCQQYANTKFTEYTKERSLRLSDQALYLETAYNVCMRDKGFNG